MSVSIVNTAVSSFFDCFLSVLHLSAPPLRLDVELERESGYLAPHLTSVSSLSLPAPPLMKIKIRLRRDDDRNSDSSTIGQSLAWDLEAPLSASRLVFWGGSGYAWGGLWASGGVLDTLPLPPASSPPSSVYLYQGRYVSSISNFSLRILSLRFESRGGEGPTSSNASTSGSSASLPAAPVCSPYTSLHCPATLRALEKGVYGRRTLLLRMRGEAFFPSALSLFFDEEARRIYERLFSLLFRVRGVCHMLERMWVRGEGESVGVGVGGELERAVGRLRHAMHFFVSNLYYYLQVFLCFVYVSIDHCFEITL